MWRKIVVVDFILAAIVAISFGFMMGSLVAQSLVSMIMLFFVFVLLAVIGMWASFNLPDWISGSYYDRAGGGSFGSLLVYALFVIVFASCIVLVMV